MNPLIKQFYHEIGAWIDAGFPRHPAFSIDAGLCSNFRWWLEEHRHDPQLHFQHKQMFACFDCSITPFNADYPEYSSELNKFTNPKRLAWINLIRSL